ncbi:MAG: hypothetical protein HY835_09980, partial [Anaerolineae bacterium]|nr:hypothetical protein [Anaerolineae bacterium]
ECEEELGYRPTSLRLEGIFTNFVEGKSDHIAVFSTRASDIPGKKNAEIAEFAFFDPSALPQDILGGHRRRIVEFFRNPSWPKSGEW